MPDLVSTTISVFALAISSITAWLTLFRRGTVRMTQPTIISLGARSLRNAETAPPSTIFIRTLLVSTSKRGRVIESMHVRVARHESKQSFNIWTYGDDKYTRGSGLFVGEAGISANHIFFPPPDEREFRFAEGTYTLEVFATLLGERIARCLWSQSLVISQEFATALQESGAWLHFDWGPDSRRYIPHIEKQRPAPELDDLLKLTEQKGPKTKASA
jgi:hypothetical protein